MAVMMLMTNTGQRFRIENAAEGYFDYDNPEEYCLLVKVLDSSMSEVDRVFNNPISTAELRTSFVDEDNIESPFMVHTNFTVVDYIRQKRDGGILIRLKRSGA